MKMPRLLATFLLTLASMAWGCSGDSQPVPSACESACETDRLNCVDGNTFTEEACRIQARTCVQACAEGGMGGAGGTAGQAGRGGTAGQGAIQDMYIPPLPIDMGVSMDMAVNEDVESLESCVARMNGFLRSTAANAGCGNYDEADKDNPNSAYHREPVVAACIQMACDGQTIQGHNGIPATRSCGELEDLVLVLSGALEEALGVNMMAADCTEPDFNVRVIAIGDFVGGEPCDQLGCALDAQGGVVSVDNRRN